MLTLLLNFQFLCGSMFGMSISQQAEDTIFAEKAHYNLQGGFGGICLFIIFLITPYYCFCFDL